MGRSFDNISIRKNDNIGLDEIKNIVCRLLNKREYSLVENPVDADGSCIVISKNDSEWYTVCSDLISFETPKEFKAIATPISGLLETDVMGIACFDSDALFLNLINYEERINALSVVGCESELGIKGKKGVSAWKTKVTNIKEFAKCINTEYLFAEQVLYDVAELLKLPAEQSASSFSDINESDVLIRLYFKNTENDERPTEFKFYSGSSIPFKMETNNTVSVINCGKESQGIKVFFIGNYVENDEIVFDASIGSQRLVLEKYRNSNGDWAYGAHCPDIKIPAIDKKLKGVKLISEEQKKCISINFVPHGNGRKVFDIIVCIAPAENWKGRMLYYTWRGYSSARQFIEENNAHVRKIGFPDSFLINADDYDV